MPILTSRGRRAGGVPIIPTVPDAPVLDGTPGNTVANLSWTVPDDNGSGITSFRVYRGGVLIASPAITTFADTGRTNGTTYSYRVSAVNGVGESVLSNEVLVTPVADPPAAPVLDGFASSTRCDLSWTTPANGGAAITGYRLYRNGVLLQALGVVTTFTDLTVSNGSTYTYTVSAVNSSGEGPLSNQLPLSPASGGAIVLPSNAIVGQPAWRMLYWTDNIPFFVSDPDLITEWTDHGGRGDIIDAGYQPLANFVPGPNAASPQQRVNPVSAGGQGNAQLYYDQGWELYLKLYISTNAHTIPDWFDDAGWATFNAKYSTLAQALVFMGMHGFGWDSEGTDYTNFKAGHTVDENRAKARQRGKETGVAIFTPFPACRILWYNFGVPGGYSNMIDYDAGLKRNPPIVKWYYPAPNAPYTVADQVPLAVDYFIGLFEGMKQVGGTGEICLANARYYRAPDVTLGGNYINAYKADTYGCRAWLTKYIDDPILSSFVLDHYFNHAFTWHSSTWKEPPGNEVFYDNTDPSPSKWAEMVAAARIGSEGSRRVEYTKQGDPNFVLPQVHNPTASEYDNPTMIAGGLAAADQSQIAGAALPVISNKSAVVSDGTVMISFRVQHAQGPRVVNIYRGSTYNKDNPAPSLLGSPQMTWTFPSGDAWSNLKVVGGYDASYQQCVLGGISGAAGDVFVIEVKSVKDDVVYETVTAA